MNAQKMIQTSILILFTICFMTGYAHAFAESSYLNRQAVTEDYLEKMDQYLGQEDFQYSFVKGDQYVLTDISCTGKRLCDTIERYWTIDSVNDEKVIFSINTGSNGKPGKEKPMTSELTKEKWVSVNNNPVRILIQSMESFGLRVEILSFEDETISLPPYKEQILSKKVNMRISNQFGETGTRTYFLWNQLPGLNKIVHRIEFDRLMSSTRDIELLKVNLQTRP